MKIGIDASRAFLKNRTGIEEYCYQVVKYLRNELKNFEVVLYLRPNKSFFKCCDFSIPKKWKLRTINFPRLWTQVGLSLEMIRNPVDVLFVPAHTVPVIHPNNFLLKTINQLKKNKRKPKTIVVIHGLEYEFLPKAYSRWERFYMRQSIKKSCQWATNIVAVSGNTKKDLTRLYNIPRNKIKVIYEGIGNVLLEKKNNKTTKISKDLEIIIKKHKYILFVGRIEERKNIFGIIKSFEILKTKHNIPHKLILAGGFGYGYTKIIDQIENSKIKNDIFLTGYISQNKKVYLLRKSDLFLFPSFYEGFGLPVLESQKMGVPIVASDKSSIPEVVGRYMKPFLVNPNNPEEIARVSLKIINDKKTRNDIIKLGYKNIERFSWDGCARNIANIIKND